MRNGVHPVVLGGTLVGVLDIAAAFVLAWTRGTAPLRVLQGIASGALGPAAFQGGVSTALLGLAFQFLIAFVVVAVYYTASGWWTVLVRRPVLCGTAYGVAVYLFMNQVVLPLSRVTPRTPPWPVVVSLVVIHILCVGLPAALTVARAARRRGQPDAGHATNA